MVRAVHFIELRTALGEAAGQAGVTPPSYTDVTLTAGVTVIRAIHLNELRSAVDRLEWRRTDQRGHARRRRMKPCDRVPVVSRPGVGATERARKMTLLEHKK